MAFYETIYVIDPDLSEENISSLNEKFKGILVKNDAKVINFEDWGRRKLAYKVKGHLKGYYALVNYEGSPSVIAELERNLKVTDGVIKFFSVVLGRDEAARLNKRLASRKESQEKAAAMSAAAPVIAPVVAEKEEENKQE